MLYHVQLRSETNEYLRADGDRNPGPFLQSADVFCQQLFGKDGVLPASAEGTTEAVVVLQGAPRHSRL